MKYEQTSGGGCTNAPVSGYIRDVLKRTGAAASDDWSVDALGNLLGKSYIISQHGAVAIDAVDQYFPDAKLGKIDRVVDRVRLGIRPPAIDPDFVFSEQRLPHVYGGHDA